MLTQLTATIRVSPAGEAHFSVFTAPQPVREVSEAPNGFLRLLPQGSSVVAPGFRVRAESQARLVPQLIR